MNIPKSAPIANPAVLESEKAAKALNTSGAPFPKAKNVTPWRSFIKENSFLPSC